MDTSSFELAQPTGLLPEEIHLCVETLQTARHLRTACEPLTQLFPAIQISDAYRISSLRLQALLESPQIKKTGKKVGLTSLAVQAQLGVHEPDFGYLTSDMHLSSGACLPRGSLLQGRAEGEIAFLLKDDLKGPDVTPNDVLRATSALIPCIEIIDSRIRDWKIQIQDTIADNASSAFFVLGPAFRDPYAVDLPTESLSLSKNGQVVSTGNGTACLGDPLNAVAWLANRLAEWGDFLQAGEIILSGALGPVTPVQEGDHCEAQFGTLGKVSFFYGAYGN